MKDWLVCAHCNESVLIKDIEKHVKEEHFEM